MNIKINGKILIAAPTGEIDHHAAERFRAQIDSAFEKSSCRHIILDMKDVTFMDSSGIGMIIGRYKKAESGGGKLTLSNMSEAVTKLFNISGLAKIISRAENTQEAIIKLGGNIND
ncbi:MAG: anti-sigma F factor antagonist [Defluviitaleaceae bacterium]|nr:anti-sigma F factor antagonist [Defluviitaleaceae bacterium]